MQRLGQLIMVVYVTACCHPKGDRGPDFGLGDLARAVSGSMSSAKCVEIFDHLFTRAAGLARKRRQRPDAAPLDWAAIVGEAESVKFGALVGTQEAEDTTRRIMREEGSPSGRKSPRREDETDGETKPEGGAKRGKRGGKAEKEKEAKRVAADKTKEAAAVTRGLGETHISPQAEAATVVASAGDVTAAIKALDLNKSDLVVKNFSTGEVREETASHLFNKGVRLCFPDMKGSDAPCFFAWMAKSGCKGPNAPGKPCDNCKRAEKLGAKAVKPPAELMTAIKAKANESTKALLK